MTFTAQHYSPLQLSDFLRAQARISAYVHESDLQHHHAYSQRYSAKVLIKREDQQQVRSFKIRGALNAILQLPQLGSLVCASAGNHAQGFAFACALLERQGTVFMPINTPKQKVERVKHFGGEYVQLCLVGDDFDAAKAQALDYCKRQNAYFVHPFDDPRVIAGQATLALEILHQQHSIDYLVLPMGGGGLAAGCSEVFRQLSPSTKIILVEPEGAASFQNSLALGKNSTLATVDTFADGTAVRRKGELCFTYCQRNMHQALTVTNAQISQTLVELFNQDAIVAEPSGALALAALDQLTEQIAGKTVVTVLSGSNCDASRMSDFLARSQALQQVASTTR
ncbi:pyridoxal-phosphate dependent enzyme [Salinibius halmophilus]|uniref:pyridoxal-phosphate dependent enzyme n=1 Tax=Salinibius halmophilus TaxID=1853216 RepID=UPI000E66161A|nr:pyridoxal-phosphate dependent enzyme [Salinibius halmophilus]